MSIVSIVRGEDPDRMVREALELLGELRSIVSGNNALIKPNLGVWGTLNIPRWLNRSMTTKSEVIVALVRILKEVGIDDISVGDGAILDMDATEQLKKSGMKKIVEAVGGKVIDLDREGHTKVQVADNLTLEIAKSVLETQNLINVPVMKTHILTKVSLGIKNLKGVVSKESKKVMHRKDLEQSIAILCKAVRPKLTVMDGLIGIEGLGPGITGKPTKPGLLIAGTDPIAVDAITALVMGQEPKEVEHIRIAWELGLGEIEPDRIEVRGLPLEEAKYPFKPAQQGLHHIIQGLGIKGIRYFGWKPGDVGSECSGCSDTLYGALWALKSDRATIQRPLDIVIGQEDVPTEIGDNILFYGNCQAKNRTRGAWQRGCPPTYMNAYISIARLTLSRPSYIWTLSKRLFKGYKVRPLPEWEDYRRLTND